MKWLSGAGSRNRTRDLLITNQLLYQLSYAGVLIWLGGATGDKSSKNAWPGRQQQSACQAMLCRDPVSKRFLAMPPEQPKPILLL